jgi:hypothetical protein
MHKHLYRKNICPTEKEDIELTELIIQTVLKKRIYKAPPQIAPQPPPNQNQNQNTNTTYNYNNTLNVINTLMTPVEKLMRFIEYNNGSIVPFENHIEEKYESIKEKLENDDLKYGHTLHIDDFHGVIDEISQSRNKDYHDLNILYDSELNKINLLDHKGQWQESLINPGIQKIITLIQYHYLDEYECYLIRKLKTLSNHYDVQCKKEVLQEYYKFIAAFDLYPYCKEGADFNIPFDLHCKVNEIQAEFYEIFCKIKLSLKPTDVKNIRKTAIDIIKRNSAKNLKNLNTSISVLFAKNKEFQEFMISAQETSRILGLPHDVNDDNEIYSNRG